MSGPVILPLPNIYFDLQTLIRDVIARQGNEERPPSPTASNASSILSSLPPSPDLAPLDELNDALGHEPLPLFLNPSEHPPQKQQKKNTKITPSHRQARKTAAGNAARKERRARMAGQPPQPKPGPRRRHLEKAVPIVLDNFDTQNLPSSKTGYIGIDNAPKRPRSVTLRDAIGKHSLALQKWDGRYFFFSAFFIALVLTAHSFSAGIVDKNGCVVAILAGHPADQDWTLLQAQAAEALESRRARCDIPRSKGRHRRGKFVTLNCGVSYGGSQQVPGNLHNEPANEAVLSELNSLPVFKRLAGFASCTYRAFEIDLF